jgi:hypothetical protein
MRIVKPRSGSGDATNMSADPAAQPATPQPQSARPAAPMQWPGAELLTDPVTAQVLMSVWSGDPAVLVPSPPGAGKTRLVVLLAAALSHRAGLRVGIAAQTRAQSLDVARRLAATCDHRKIALLWKRTVHPDSGGCPVLNGGMAVWPKSGGAVRWRPRRAGCSPNPIRPVRTC